MYKKNLTTENVNSVLVILNFQKTMLKLVKIITADIQQFCLGCFCLEAKLSNWLTSLGT